MKLYVDTDNKKLVISQNSDRQAQAPIFMQGDNEPLEIHLLTSGEQNLFDDKVFDTQKDFLKIAIARFKGEPKMLSFCDTYTALKEGGCVAVLPLNTVEIETVVGNNQSIDAFFEIEYATSDGRITTILQTPCKLKNDLIENDVSVELQPTFQNYVNQCEQIKSDLGNGNLTYKTLVMQPIDENGEALNERVKISLIKYGDGNYGLGNFKKL